MQMPGRYIEIIDLMKNFELCWSLDELLISIENISSFGRNTCSSYI